jgi:deoxyinosine 3'endonuclease (endonuclease V)
MESTSTDNLDSFKLVAGCDISYFPDGKQAIACVVILDFLSQKVIHEEISEVIDLSDQPYVSGQLALRYVIYIPHGSSGKDRF